MKLTVRELAAIQFALAEYIKNSEEIALKQSNQLVTDVYADRCSIYCSALETVNEMYSKLAQAEVPSLEFKVRDESGKK
jgi:hypothetical protein